MRRFYLSLGLFVGLVATVQAQSFYSLRRERSLIATVGTGTSTYFGELSNDGDYLQAKPNFNVGLQYYFSSRISARAEASWFQLSGSDAKADPTGENYRKVRNLSFRTDAVEISVTGAVNLFPMGNRYYRRPGFNVYAFGGIGGMYFNPTTVYQGKRVALQPLQTELVHYSKFGIVIPFGLGVRFRTGPNTNISIEGGYRKTFTDYLDDVSTVHHDASKYSSPLAAALSDRGPEVGYPLSVEGWIRGNPKTKDGYMLLSIKLEYYLPDNFQIFGGGSQRKGGGSFNRKRNSSFYRYNRGGKLRR
jgi:hypothetical protein